ncbi:MAG: amino acid permease [Marinilabiliaceae bacterium]|jgi:amino acid transporter|nr:amino acid permease [Marinilabiliaceae bacterium]
MAKLVSEQKANFGTGPVFMTAVSTILGAILFLRFGYAVANVSFIGVLGIILLGHLVTFPTAMAVAEISTNQKVRGGGAYYIISRSFGINIGASIGLALFLSQAISVAFYIIAFAEAFDPLLTWVADRWDIVITDKRWISIPTMALLSVLFLTRGANLGMKFLYLVVALLFTSLALFFAGKGESPPETINLGERIADPDNFFLVFMIVFPAFTGLAAGLGLSGDLREPQKSIPRGTLLATAAGFFIYIAVAYKLTISATPEDMDSNQLIMGKIALWGPIIPIGLAAASLSSALGSIMVAPRTLQALGNDRVFPSKKISKWFARGRPRSNEPVNSSLVTILIALIFIIVGDIDFVAQIISMFFMATYGAICLISVLEHFAADPSYRPTFRSRWYISAIGALLSIWLMFKMNTFYAIVSIILMALFYYMISKTGSGRRGLAKLFRGVVFQLSRQLQIFAQRADKEDLNSSWRPFAICISSDSFKRRTAFDLLRWISYRHGFGTYIHYIKGFLNQETNHESKQAVNKLLNLSSGSKSRVYLDTIISPSYTTAIAQVIQLSGISGKGNNMILFEYSRTEPEALEEPLDNYELISSTGFDVCVLNTSYKGFGYRREIHVWLSPSDFKNSNLMILMAYIILGHPDWQNAEIKIFASANNEQFESKKTELMELIRSGRLPISASNIQLINADREFQEVVCRNSLDADLTILGFTAEELKDKGVDIFRGYKDLGNILFVNANEDKEIS